jgi:putative acetyltransferase
MSAPDDPRFEFSRNRRFKQRTGAAPQSSSSKLCIVATDAALLVDLLYGLSLRKDCHYVKYGLVERDGMFLGRCFLETNEAVAELCQELKGHARLMVSIQDDAYFGHFRRALATGDPFDDSTENEADVASVHLHAFGRRSEAEIVRRVCASRVPVVSLVVEDHVDGSDVPGIVGHVLLSPVTLDGRSDPPGLGLGPLAVLPSHQRRGLGARLVEAALRRARSLGYAYVVVLGQATYYPRFGFVPASGYGIRYEHDVPDEVFMVLELTPGALSWTGGILRYQPAFAEG